MEIRAEAKFAQAKTLRSLLKQKTRRIAFLISVGQDYHNNHYLLATVNLVEQLITLDEKLSKDTSATWQIDIIVADTLQAYNDARDEVSLLTEQEKWSERGKIWRNYAEAAFLPIRNLKRVHLRFHLWNDLLEKAKNYEFDEDFCKLYSSYYGDNETFKKWVDDKADNYLQRQMKRVDAPRDSVNYDYRIHYILEEIALLKGSASKGLFDLIPTQDEIVLIYPSIEEKAFRLGQEILFPHPTRCRMVWHEIKLSTDISPPTFILRGFSDSICYTDKQIVADNERSIINVLDGLGLLKRNDKVFPSLFPEECEFIKREEYAPYFSRPKETKALVFFGLGGMGKTAIVGNFFNNCVFDNTYQYYLWFSAENGRKKHISAQIREFFKRLYSVSDKKNQVERLRDEKLHRYFFDWLNAQDSWVIVFNDIENYAEITDYAKLVNDRRGMYVTSRNAPPIEISQYFCTANVGVMNPIEVREMINRLLGIEVAEEDFVALQSRIKGFALHLFLTLKYLQQNPSKSIKQYLHESEDDSIYSPVKKVINYSLCHIDPIQTSSCEKSVARYLLYFVTYLKCAGIDIKLLKAWFKHYYEGMENEVLEEAINELQDYSLLNRQGDSLFLHPIVHSILTEIGHEEKFLPLKKTELDHRLLKWHFSIAGAFCDVLWDNFDMDLDEVIPAYFNYITHLDGYSDILRLGMNLYQRKLLDSETNWIGAKLSELPIGDTELDIVRNIAKCGGIHSFFGDKVEGKNCLDNAIDLLRDKLLGVPTIEEVRALIKLVFLQHFLKHNQDSKQSFIELISVVQRVPEAHQQELLKVFTVLVHVFLQEGNLEAGLEVYLNICSDLLQRQGGQKILAILANLASEKSSQQPSLINIASMFAAQLGKFTTSSGHNNNFEPPK